MRISTHGERFLGKEYKRNIPPIHVHAICLSPPNPFFVRLIVIYIKETWVVFWVKLDVFWMFCGEEVKMKVMDEEVKEGSSRVRRYRDSNPRPSKWKSSVQTIELRRLKQDCNR